MDNREPAPSSSEKMSAGFSASQAPPLRTALPHVPLAILGGGIAGLAAGYFSRLADRPFVLFEAESRPGGMCRTLSFGDFLVDTGAHRFHAKIPAATAELRALLGAELVDVDIPSEIYDGGRFVRFPLEPVNLLRARGPAFIIAAAGDLLWSRLRRGKGPPEDLEAFSLARYGGRIARRYLLNYSEKLWGMPARELSPAVAGTRLQGLKPSTMLALLSRRAPAATSHFEGTFLYPRQGGIEVISRALADACGRENIRCGSAISRVFHQKGLVTAIEIKGRQTAEVDGVISTLPLTSLLGILTPPPPEAISRAASGLKLRSLVLVILLLDQEAVTNAATVYFPGWEFPFTRVYEPSRRSSSMSPPGKTSLVAEFPCAFGDAVWEADDETLISRMIGPLASLGWVRRDRIRFAAIHRLRHAYPVVAKDAASRLEVAHGYLRSFRNLALAGRLGRFHYSHIHDHIQEGREAAAALAEAEGM